MTKIKSGRVGVGSWVKWRYCADLGQASLKLNLHKIDNFVWISWDTKSSSLTLDIKPGYLVKSLSSQSPNSKSTN